MTCVERIRLIRGVNYGVITDEQIQELFVFFDLDEEQKKVFLQFLKKAKLKNLKTFSLLKNLKLLKNSTMSLPTRLKQLKHFQATNMCLMKKLHHT